MPNATPDTPCARCGGVSPNGGNFVRENQEESLCEGAFLDGICDGKERDDEMDALAMGREPDTRPRHDGEDDRCLSIASGRLQGLLWDRVEPD